MMSLVVALALFAWIVLPFLQRLTGNIGGRAGLALFALVGMGAVLCELAALHPGALVILGVVYFGAGGVLFAWEGWQDGAAGRAARAKVAQLTPTRMRRPLPPAAPMPPAPRPIAPPTQRGTP